MALDCRNCGLLYFLSCASARRDDAERYRKSFFTNTKRECPEIITLDGHKVGFIKGGKRNQFPQLGQLKHRLAIRPAELESKDVGQNPILRVELAKKAIQVVDDIVALDNEIESKGLEAKGVVAQVEQIRSETDAINKCASQLSQSF